jgi:phytanoyl-CoA hydroxylase
MNSSADSIAQEVQFFYDNGYLIKKNFVGVNHINQLQKKVHEHLEKRIQPFELEQQVHYPGSPVTLEEKGGDTIRRLLMTYSRDKLFKAWAENPQVLVLIKSLLNSQELFFVQSHHNCVMTKQPQFSSETHWHKDTRYWNFENQHLINTWLPLDDETKENGCLQILPGSHLWDTPKENLDGRLFLNKELKKNQQWLEKSINVELKKGDLLFFHAAIFHAAGRNHTHKSKNAVVSTYHSENNQEIKNPYPSYPAIKL